MAFSYDNYTGNGTTTQFSITFTYQDTAEISVTVDGVAETGLTFPSSSTVQLTSAPASGTLVQVRRTTDLAAREVDFASGSVLTEEDLDDSNIQVFHAAQEAVDKANDSIFLDTDDKWEANSKVIKNVADPVDNTDAVNKQFISTNLPNITTVANISTDVTTVAGISSDVTAVVADATDIGTVSTNIASVNTVATNINDVITIAGISSDVTAVVADATDIGTVSTNIADVNTVAGISADVTTVAADGTDIGVVAGISSDVTTVSGISANVTSVAGNASNINAVAADATDIGTVATNIANVNTVAGIDSDVTTVAGISADVTAAATNNANITTVANNISNVNSVAAIDTDVTTVAGMSSADITTVAGISANVTTVAGIDADVTTVAGIAADVTAAATNVADISTIAAEVAKVVTVANDLNEATSEIDTVANSIANVDLVGASITDVNTVASNLSGITAFADVYASGPTDPTTNLNEGDLFFNTTSDTLKVYNGTAWEAGVTAGSGFLPLTGGQLTGNLTFSGSETVDGRDVSVDGTKLDGIEAGADVTDTANVTAAGALMATGGSVTGNVSFGDNDKAIFGAGSDLQIYHDGSNSYIQDTGTGDLKIYANDFNVWTSTGSARYLDATSGGAVNLYHNGNAKLATTSTGIDVTGTVTADGLSVGDNQNITVGNSNDLYIYHNGSNSHIEDRGAGDLVLKSNNNMWFQDYGTNEVMLKLDSGGAASLYYDNAAKLATTSTGVDVTGEMQADSIVMNDNETIYLGNSADLRIYHNGGNSIISDVGTGDLYLAGDNLRLTNAALSKAYARGYNGGKFSLMYDNVEKLATTSYGIDISGSVVADTQTASKSGSQTPDFDTYQNFLWTLTGNITLANPTTEKKGQTGFFIFIHSGGARTVSLQGQYGTAGGAGLTLSGTAGAVDIVPYVVRQAGFVYLGTPQLAFS